MGRPKGSKNHVTLKLCEKCKKEFMSTGKGHRFCSRVCSQFGYGTFGKKPIDPIKRFWFYVKKTDSCWLWQGVKREGYGRMRKDYKLSSAHRFSWEIHNGPIPKGIYVLHSCDNPPCVNPSHLWLGTYTDNNRDRSKKGRNNHALGSKCPKAKLKGKDIEKIIKLRLSGMPYQKIARKYHVDTRAIWQIFIGKTWGHIFNKSVLSLNVQGELDAITRKNARGKRQAVKNDDIWTSRNRENDVRHTVS